MKKKLDLTEDKLAKYLLLFSFMVCLIIGIALSYNFDFTRNYNLLFESDTARVIGDMTKYDFPHARTNLHPLFVMLTEPIFFLVNAIFINKMLSLIIISSLVTSLTVFFIYKILSLYGSTKSLKTLLCLCYLFSFANYIFTAGIELYNIATLCLVLLWYYVLKKYPDFGNKLSNPKLFILIVFGILNFSITITNVFIFFIIIFFLLVFKKINFKNAFFAVLIVIIATFELSVLQKLLWHNTETIISSRNTEEITYSSFSITPHKILNVLKNNYYYAFIGNDSHLESNNHKVYDRTNYVISFNNKNNHLTIGVVATFYILFLIVLIRNYKKQLFVNLCLTFAILFNTILHIFYGNELPFLYSLHFLYLFYLGFGINLLHEKNNTLLNITKYYLIILLLLELIFTNKHFIKVIKIVKSVLPCNFYTANFDVILSTIFILLAMLIIGIIIYFIYLSYKEIKISKDKDYKIKYGIIIAILVIIIQSICISLEANQNSKMIFFKKIENNSNEVFLNPTKYLESNLDKLKEHFKKESKAYNEYQKEHAKLLRKYHPKEVNFLNSENYYFFGLGNRRKLLFQDNALIDIATGKTVYFWNVASSLVIPNEYTVLIETFKSEYIKIYEDNDGVHYNINGHDSIIEGTDTKINLYDFKGEKWSNTKKVLYSEIFFNIKDSKIYPNIIVYDNPWYRDAAMASMVLNYTGNTDLISDWINSITEVYDKQNKGMSEPDNLGELLYIISTQDKPNNELIQKIEIEANRVAKNNKAGYYLTGQTDYSVKPLYQNLWYQCGINRLGKEFPFSLKGLDDDYGYLTLWMDNKVTNKKYLVDINYPYLSVATYHKLKKGSFPMNSNLYPLSWEKNASEANYKKMQILGNNYVDDKISPLHVWSAAELLLLLIDEDNNLKICYN